VNEKFAQFFVAVIFLLTGCRQVVVTDIPTTTVKPVIVDTLSPSPIPTNTERLIPTETPNPLVQPDAFPTETPNATAQAIAAKWSSSFALPSPDGLWAALDSQPGFLRVVQVNGDKEYTIPCDTFSRCEFVKALQWSPDGSTLYFAPSLTGESNIPFELYTGIARINVASGKIEKLVEDSLSDMQYDLSLSPDGNTLPTRI
jgi:hypothetical protein